MTVSQILVSEHASLQQEWAHDGPRWGSSLIDVSRQLAVGTSLAHVDDKLEVWHTEVWGSQQDCASEGLKEIPSKGPPEVHAQPQFRQAHRAIRQRETAPFNRLVN